VYFGGKQYKVSTGVKVYPQHWNSKKQVATISNGLTTLDNHNNTIVNNKLKSILFQFEETKLYLCNNPNEIEDFYNVLKRNINPDMKDRKKQKESKLTATIQLEQLAYKKYENKEISKSTYETYKSAIVILKTVIKERKIEDTFNNITKELIESYKEHLRKKGTETSSINVYLGKIRTLLELANDDDKIPFKSFKINNVIERKTDNEEEDDENIALTLEQIETLYNLELTGIEEEARDIFVCQCYAGQRISDMYKQFSGNYKLHKNDNGKEFIFITPKKTRNSSGKKVQIPVLPTTKQILDKYKDKELQYIKLGLGKSQYKKLNKYIKRVCKKAGFNEEVTKKGETKKLYELITSHVARHSFVTIAYYKGIKDEEIMKVTGHSREQILRIYKTTNIDGEINLLGDTFDKFEGEPTKEYNTTKEELTKEEIEIKQLEKEIKAKEKEISNVIKTRKEKEFLNKHPDKFDDMRKRKEIDKKIREKNNTPEKKIEKLKRELEYLERKYKEELLNK
jgi:site-specific recombinase XerD